MRLALRAIGGMCAVRRLISAIGFLGTSSAQKRTPCMLGISASSASLASLMPLRGMVAAQPVRQSENANTTPTQSLALYTELPPDPKNPLIAQMF